MLADLADIQLISKCSKGFRLLDKDSNFEVGHLIVAPKKFEEFFVIKKLNNLCRGQCVTSNVNGEEITGTFYK